MDLDFFDLSLKESKPATTTTASNNLDAELDAIFGLPSTKQTTAATTTTTTATPTKSPATKAADKDKGKDKDGDDEEFWGAGLKEAGPAVHINEDEKVVAEPTKFTVDLANFPSVRKFLMRPLPKGMVLQTVITRQKAGFLGKYATFDLVMDETMGQWSGKLLMCAKRQVANKTPNYHISMDRVNFDPPSKSYIGKLRSNFLGTEHVIYDDGASPEKEGVAEKDVRLELGAVLYTGGVASTSPREITVVLPDPTADKLGSSNIVSRYTATSTSGLMVLQQMKPRYNEKTKTFSLNFHGRVKVPSVKNFILTQVDQQGVEAEALLFGKFNEASDSFHMDVRWPLSPMQAFAICISCFEST